MAFLASDPPLLLVPLKPLFFPGLLAKNGEQTFMWPWTYPPVFIPPQVRLLDLCFQRISPWRWVRSNRAVLSIPPCHMLANFEASLSILKRLLLKLQLTFFLPQEAYALLRSRPSQLHKHSAGVVHLWAGSPEYPGAASLSASGALRSGAGYVRLFASRPIPDSLSPSLPELLLHSFDRGEAPKIEEFIQGASSLVIGPGLVPTPALETFLTELLPQTKLPIVLDAGALDVVARHPQILTSAAGPILLIPHAGELARLLGSPIQDRAESARIWLERFPSTLLIAKGPHTLIATKDLPFSFNGSGGPAQATAGMGDLLSGLLGGLLAVGYPTFDAARIAVSWHGLASDLAIRQGGPSTLATDLLPMLPASWRILAGRAE